ncbi:MAG: hypothetical protein PHW41_01830 [Eubacteriales bacterium]|nr:hypothetical protein [Eubacteriales bacterium]
MSKEKQTTEQYINSVHRVGRIGGAIMIVVMISMPIIAGIYFDATPSIGQIIQASIGLLAIFVPIAISEVISYTPVLGSSIYLTLVTGNVLNLKLPVANNAMHLMDVQYGSEKADVIGSIAVSVSSILTVVIIALGMLLMVPLQPVFNLPAVKTASAYVLPALFGSMALGIFNDNLGGGIRAPGRLKGAIVPTIIVLTLSIADKYILKTGMLSSVQGVLILMMLPITYFITKSLYKKGKIQVILPEGEKADATVQAADE